MLPAPARIAAAPSPKSRGSWNPDVPPPPVGGAAVGNGLADGLGVADDDAGGLADGDADGLAEDLVDGLAEDLADGLVEGLALALGVEGLAEPVGVAEELPGGEAGGRSAEGEDVEQAEMAAEASTVTMPQPTAVSRAPSHVPAVVVRAFMEPPRASDRWRHRFPVPHQKPTWEGKPRGRPRLLPAPLNAGPLMRRGQ